MTLYYWQHQGNRLLEGEPEYLRRFHLDYEPQPTKQEALDACRAFLQKEHDYYASIAQRKLNLMNGVPKTQ